MQKVEEILSEDKHQKAIIYFRDDGMYEVVFEALMEDFNAEINYRTEYWGPFLSGSLTDTRENAQKLARDVIKPSENDAYS
jgi:hypothetical protein